MRSSKSRSRSKSSRQRSSLGNIVNRVFDSSGPEGKVRGTPQQIIDKYLTLARDAQLGNDRVSAENFLQHAEHYARMLSEAQREIEAQRQQSQQNVQQNGGDQGRDRSAGQESGEGRDDGRGDRRDDRGREDRRERKRERVASDVIEVDADDGPGLVETPEMRGSPSPDASEPGEQAEPSKPKQRRPRKPKAAAEQAEPASQPPEAAE